MSTPVYYIGVLSTPVYYIGVLGVLYYIGVRSTPVCYIGVIEHTGLLYRCVQLCCCIGVYRCATV
jgi:hypothetical protein